SLANHKISPRIAHIKAFVIIRYVEEVANVLGKVSLSVEVKVFYGSPFCRIGSFHCFATFSHGGSIKGFLKIGVDVPIEVKILVYNVEIEQLLQRQIKKVGVSRRVGLWKRRKCTQYH